MKARVSEKDSAKKRSVRERELDPYLANLLSVLSV